MEAEENANGMAGFSGFPNEVLVLILQLLDLKSLIKCHDVCKSWRRYSLFESNYLPHVLHAYTQLTYGTRPLPANLSAPEKSDVLKHIFKTSVSALPVFVECRTLRDIAIKLQQLEESWLSGSNTSFVQLNRGDVHDLSILSVAIDTRGGSIVTGDAGGLFAFWDATTGALQYKSRFLFDAGHVVVPSKIVFEEDLMVVGTLIGGVIVAVRNPWGGREPFCRVTEFWTASAEVTSIRMEGYTCIVGESGAVSFWDLSRCAGPPSLYADPMPPVRLLMTIDTRSDSTPVEASPSYSIFYRDGLLFLGLAGSQIQQIGAHSSTDEPGRKLWETDGYTYASFASGPTFLGRREWGTSHICPIGASGDIVVSWPDCSIFRLGSEMEDDLVWEPLSERLIPPVPGRHSPGVFVRGDHVICRFMSHEIEMFLADGKPIGKIPCRYGAINCMAVDPSFIAVATKEASLCVYYFASRSQWVSNGQGPLPSAASTVLPSPELERRHTYKRKYTDAIGIDAEKRGATIARNGHTDLAPRTRRGISGGVSLAHVDSQQRVEFAVPAP